MPRLGEDSLIPSWAFWGGMGAVGLTYGVRAWNQLANAPGADLAFRGLSWSARNIEHNQRAATNVEQLFKRSKYVNEGITKRSLLSESKPLGIVEFDEVLKGFETRGLVTAEARTKFLEGIRPAFERAVVVTHAETQLPVALDITYRAGQKTTSFMLPILQSQKALTGDVTLSPDILSVLAVRKREMGYIPGAMYTAMHVADPRRALTGLSRNETVATDLRRVNVMQYLFESFSQEGVMKNILSGEIDPSKYLEGFEERTFYAPLTDYRAGASEVAHSGEAFKRSRQTIIMNQFLQTPGTRELKSYATETSPGIFELTEGGSRQLTIALPELLPGSSSSPTAGTVMLPEQQAEVRKLFYGSAYNVDMRQVMRPNTVTLDPSSKYYSSLSKGRKLFPGIATQIGKEAVPISVRSLFIDSEKMTAHLESLGFPKGFTLAKEEMFMPYEMGRAIRINGPRKTYRVKQALLNQDLQNVLLELEKSTIDGRPGVNWENPEGVQAQLKKWAESATKEKRLVTFGAGVELGVSPNIVEKGNPEIVRLNRSGKKHILENIRLFKGARGEGYVEATFKSQWKLSEAITKMFLSEKKRVRPMRDIDVALIMLAEKHQGYTAGLYKEKLLEDLPGLEATGIVKNFRELVELEFRTTFGRGQLRALTTTHPFEKFFKGVPKTATLHDVLTQKGGALKSANIQSMMLALLDLNISSKKKGEIKRIIQDPNLDDLQKMNKVSPMVTVGDIINPEFTHSFIPDQPDIYYAGGKVRYTKDLYAMIQSGPEREALQPFLEDIRSRAVGAEVSAEAASILERTRSMASTVLHKTITGEVLPLEELARFGNNLNWDKLQAVSQRHGGASWLDLGNFVNIEEMGGSIRYVELPTSPAFANEMRTMLQNDEEIAQSLLNSVKRLINSAGGKDIKSALQGYLEEQKSLAISAKGEIQGSVYLTASSTIQEKNPFTVAIPEKYIKRMHKEIGTTLDEVTGEFLGMAARDPNISYSRNVPVRIVSTESFLRKSIGNKFYNLIPIGEEVYMSPMLKALLGADSDGDIIKIMLAGSELSKTSLDNVITGAEAAYEQFSKNLSANVVEGIGTKFGYAAAFFEKAYGLLKSGTNVNPYLFETLDDLIQSDATRKLLEKVGIGKAHGAMNAVRTSLRLSSETSYKAVHALATTVLLEEQIIKAKYAKGSLAEIKRLATGGYLAEMMDEAIEAGDPQQFVNTAYGILGIDPETFADKKVLSNITEGAEEMIRTYSKFRGTDELQAAILLNQTHGDRVKVEDFLNVLQKQKKVASQYYGTIQEATMNYKALGQDIPERFGTMINKFGKLSTGAKVGLAGGAFAALAGASSLIGQMKASTAVAEIDIDKSRKFEDAYKISRLQKNAYASRVQGEGGKFSSLSAVIDEAFPVKDRIANINRSYGNNVNVSVFDYSRNVDIDMLQHQMEQ